MSHSSYDYEDMIEKEIPLMFFLRFLFISANISSYLLMISNRF